jgi:hypothetical protein
MGAHGRSERGYTQELAAPMIAAIGLFLIGAAAGIFLAIRHFTRRRLPGWVAVAHGLAGASGFAVLMLCCAREPTMAAARTALGILVFAITLGCVNVVYHLRGRRHRSTIIVAHALAAVSGVGTLAYAALDRDGTLAAAAPGGAHAAAEPSAATVSGTVLAAAEEPGRPRAPSPEGTAATPIVQTPSSARVGWAWVDRSVRFERGSAAPADLSIADLDAVAAMVLRVRPLRRARARILRRRATRSRRGARTDASSSSCSRRRESDFTAR